MRNLKKNRENYYDQEKTPSIETDPHRIQLLEGADKNFKTISTFEILGVKKVKRLGISVENCKLKYIYI